MSEIKGIINKRSSINKKVKKLYDIAMQASLEGASEKTKKDFFIRYENLDDDVTKFESFHLDIVGLIEESKIEEQEKVQDAFNDMQFAIRSIYRDLGEIPSQVKDDNSSVHGESNSVRFDRRERIRLPKIEIPKFDGHLKKWPTFFDLFRTLIHECSSLTNIERFQFLVSYLEREAATVIKNIPITDANYVTAYNALVKRYQNDRVLVTDYWLSIYHAPCVKIKSAVELRRLLSIFSENLAALDLFKLDLWDFTKFNLLFQRMDSSLKTMFELEYSHKQFPAYNDLYSFLEKQCGALENSQLFTKGDSNSVNTNSVNTNRGNIVDRSGKGGQGGSNSHGRISGQHGTTYSFISNTDNSKCIFCNQSAHSLIKCDAFLSADVNVRHSFVKNSRLCFNCLSMGHSLEKCTSLSNCRVCRKRHHTLLHFPSKPVNSENAEPLLTGNRPVKSMTSDERLKVFSSRVPSQKCMLLATAVVAVIDSCGKPVKCRALLDSASQASFISEACSKRLNLQHSSVSTPIQGLSQMSMCASSGNVSLKISPYGRSTPAYSVDAVVLPQICDCVPSIPFSSRKWRYLQKLDLADPEFNTSSDVDILLGVNIFAEIIKPGFRKSQNGGPSAMNTALGWILFGSVESMPNLAPKVLSCFTALSTPLDETMKKFWELECVPAPKAMSSDDSFCEKVFCETYKRDLNGRYVVELPFRVFPPSLGDSKTQALRRFLHLENRLENNRDLKTLYLEFMRDYCDQGHMSVAEPLTCDNGYFIPHHCVLKGQGESRKIRVVFDGSAKSSNGLSLNDGLLVGPKLQNEITSILLNFRIFSVVFTADIRQMYRQILVAEEHRNFQRIVWRFSQSEPIQEYQLNTVTYGLTSSPYLAIRTLLQLAVDHGEDYSLAKQILKRHTYVDDLMCGASSVSAALEMQQQLIKLLSLGGFELRKWSSNHPDLLKSVPNAHQQMISLSDKDSTGIKVLGLQWSPVSDCFSYSVQLVSRDCTKRHILSEIARIYDPLGFLAPTLLVAKYLIQKLWLQGADWDAVPSSDIEHEWKVYSAQLPHVSSLSIPRRFIGDETVCAEVHGFCDASEVGYASVIYLRQVLSDHNIVVSLVYAKNRVSPLKRISVPRLELCAASLLADCFEFIVSSLLGVKVSNVYAWSDSTVALTWIRSPPHRWKTFIANRVTQIQEKISPECWRYVDGKSNPADCASRGILPDQLISHPLWWAGPPWLRQAESSWPRQLNRGMSEEAAREERNLVCITTCSPSFLSELLSKYSSLQKVQRIVAYCGRFVKNARAPKPSREIGALSCGNLYDALVIITRLVQQDSFGSEILKIQKTLPCSKPLRMLAPFLDEAEVIRVGGRLRNANIAYDAKHPMLLPRSHPVTDLVIQHFHDKNLHPGPRTLQYLITEQFWILSARRAIRHVLSKCNRCFRTKPSSLAPFMSDLPPVRVLQVKAFTKCGVDFAGPIPIVLGRHRGVRSQKAYICVFVCMGTKAVHLEAVSDLTSEAFLAAFRRFTSRRGRCTDIYSDRGTNFVGANNWLLSCAKETSQWLSIKWHFNPPASPHWGGLWESAVKSVKTHLVRVVGCQLLTFEELSTFLAQIEALLNSRPLCSMSPDPNDLTSLTPGHFLTMAPLTAPPDESLIDVNLNRLNRWQLVQQLHQHFWKRWHMEYLHTLQQRAKWNCPQNAPAIGTLVVLKDSNTPPLRWLLGRIVKLYHGSDQVVRVAQVRTIKGLIDRPLVKLCPLPNQ